MVWLPCPYLGRSVELTVERLAHIEAAHPTLLPNFADALTATLSEPDFVGDRANRPEIAFVRSWPDMLGGPSFVVVVVLTSNEDEAAKIRHWIVTAYVARRVSTWRPIWKRNSP